jgi:undecaprenyl-diphosphatase
MLSPFEQATFLGVLQGLTEFLPISSDGHLALAQMLLEVDGGGLTLSVLLHTGTLLATLIYFRARIALVLVDLWQSLRQKRLPVAGTPAWDAVLVLVASVPTALIGLVLRDTVARWTEQPLATGFGFIVTALLLTSTLWTRPGSQLSPSLAAALLLGVAQGMAVAPGLSRSGATIVAALWLGVRSERAFELSMLMSIPAVAGAVLLESLGGDAMGGRVLPLSSGAVMAFGVGLVALSLLKRMVSRGHLAWFALWVLPVALATLALAKAWPGEMRRPDAATSVAPESFDD